MKAAEETKLRRYTSYAQICIFMRLDNALPDSVSLFHDDFEWIQPLDYEYVPFRCRKCHAHGHLFRDCPQNAKSTAPEVSDQQAQDGFTKVPSRKRARKKPSTGKKPHPDQASIPSTSNSFEVLANTSKKQPLKPLASLDNKKGSEGNEKVLIVGGIPTTSTELPEANPSNQEEPAKAMEMEEPPSQSWQLALISEEGNQVQQMEEEPESVDLTGLDIFELEQVCRKKEYDKIQEHQLSTMETILSRAYQEKKLGIQPGCHWDGTLIPKDSKKRGRKTDLQRTIAVGKLLVDSGRYAKLTKYYRPSTQGDQ